MRGYTPNTILYDVFHLPPREHIPRVTTPEAKLRLKLLQLKYCLQTRQPFATVLNQLARSMEEMVLSHFPRCTIHERCFDLFGNVDDILSALVRFFHRRWGFFFLTLRASHSAS